VELDDIPIHIQNRAKYLLLDGLGCALVGAHLPWSEKAAKSILALEAGGEAIVFGWEKVRCLLCFILFLSTKTADHSNQYRKLPL
jgi:aconitate decarboxylase